MRLDNVGRQLGEGGGWGRNREIEHLEDDTLGALEGEVVLPLDHVGEAGLGHNLGMGQAMEKPCYFFPREVPRVIRLSLFFSRVIRLPLFFRPWGSKTEETVSDSGVQTLVFETQSLSSVYLRGASASYTMVCFQYGQLTASSYTKEISKTAKYTH